MVPSDNDDRQIKPSAFTLRPNMFQDLATSPRALMVNPQIVREVGPGPAVVHAVLASHDDGQGSVMTHKEIAVESGTNVSMARRSIDKLVSLGHLKVESQIENLFGQKANRYQVPTWLTMDPPAHIEQAYMDVGIQEENGQEVSSSSDSSISSLLQGKPPATSAIRWLPLGSPMPILAKPKIGRKGPGRAYIEAKWAVSLLEGYVLAQSNLERQQKGWKPVDAIPEHRKLRWLSDAEILLADRPIAEVAEIIDWVFKKCSGILPFDVIDSSGLRRKDTERKVTSIRKIAENWDQLRAARSLGNTHHLRLVRHPLTDEQEHAVDQLIDAFEEFWVTSFARGQEVHPAKRGSWVKQFRQLLGEHHLDAAELLAVIEGLVKYRSEMEHQRYFEPRYFHQDAVEWDTVRHRLHVCQLREKAILEAQPVLHTISKIAWSNDEDDEDREVAAIPVPTKRTPQIEEDTWDAAPWEVRRQQIVAARIQQAAGATNFDGGSQSFTQRLQAVLDAPTASTGVA